MRISLALLLLTTACDAETGLTLSPGWKADVIAQWRDAMPDMIVLSPDGKSLFITNENRTNMLAPSLTRIDLASGARQTLLYGLDRADGLKMDSKGNLWLGEEVADGLIYNISRPDTLPAEQRFDRDRLVSSHGSIEAVGQAGHMAHEGMAFSADGKWLYLADEWKEGCLFRLSLERLQLEVLHAKKGWLAVSTPNEARLKAEILHGRYFNRLEDMERLPDGRILLAETGTGTIWILDDRGEHPSVTPYFSHAGLHHPDNLEWDTKRGALWISDDDSPSLLWLLKEGKLTKVASHRFGEITGVETAADGRVWINIQHNSLGPELTLELTGSAEQ